MHHPMNLGRDVTGTCCRGWWVNYDLGGPMPGWEDDGHHGALPGVRPARARRVKRDAEMVYPATPVPAKRARGKR